MQSSTEKQPIQKNLTVCFLNKEILELENQKKFYTNKLNLTLEIVNNDENLTVRYLKKEIKKKEQLLKLYKLRLQETKKVLSK